MSPNRNNIIIQCPPTNNGTKNNIQNKIRQQQMEYHQHVVSIETLHLQQLKDTTPTENIDNTNQDKSNLIIQSAKFAKSPLHHYYEQKTTHSITNESITPTGAARYSTIKSLTMIQIGLIIIKSQQ